MANTVIGVKENTKAQFDYEFEQAILNKVVPVEASHDDFVRKLLEKWTLDEVNP